MKLVLKEVSDLERFSKAMNIPDEVCTELCDGDEEEVVGKMSSFLLEKGLTWSCLRSGLTENNEHSNESVFWKMLSLKVLLLDSIV